MAAHQHDEVNDIRSLDKRDSTCGLPDDVFNALNLSLPHPFPKGLESEFLPTGRSYGGGGGMVFECAPRNSAWREAYGRVAVKIPHDSMDAHEVGMFDREREVYMTITGMNGRTHENLLPLLDYGQVNAIPYFVIPWVAGTDLDKYLIYETLGPREAISIVAKACDGAEWLHIHGVVHRDLKPGNIMIPEKEGADGYYDLSNPFVIDLGSAVMSGRLDDRPRQLLNPPDYLTQGSLTSSREIVGTTYYLSPEQLRGSRTLDLRSDLYSLGVTLWELITGGHPYVPPGTTDFQKVADATFNSKPREIPGNMPNRFVAGMLKAVAKNPEQRFQSARDFKSHFLSCLDHFSSNP